MEEYNKEGVEFCNSCKSLHIIEDEEGNIWCGSCDSLNHTSTLSSIEEYLNKYKFKNING